MDQIAIRHFIAQVDPVNSGLSAWLVEQVPVIVVMGVVIWWLARKLDKVEGQRNGLSESFMKLTTLYESRVNKNDELSEDIIKKLDEIIGLIKYGKGA